MPEIQLVDHAFSSRLGWSNTRSETFRTCLRRYFFVYYGRFETEVPLAQLQRLKGLTSIPMTIGHVVHEILAALLRRLLQSSEPIDHDRFIRHVEQTIERVLGSIELMEVYYGKRLAPEAGELLELAMICLDQFLPSDRFLWLQDELGHDPGFVIEPPGFGETRLRGMKIYSKVDCLIQTDSETLIPDWKTGCQDPTQHLLQLQG